MESNNNQIKHFIGEILEINGRRYFIKFLRKHGNKFTLPDIKNEVWVEKSEILRVFIVAVVPFLYVGLNSGFSTDYIYDQNRTMTESEMSSIGRSGATLSFISCLIGGYLMDKFGRKILLAFVYVVFAIGWMMTAKKETFLIGRFLGSLAIGVGCECTVYLAEVLQPQYRGAFINIKAVLEVFGNLFVCFIGYYFSSEILSFTFSICAMIFCCCTFLMPETPYWYMLKNKKSKAIESLMWLRKEDEAKVYYEINEIEKNLDGINTHIPTFLEIIVNPKWWKTFLFYSTYLLLSELSGYDMIIPYSLQFFAKFNQSQVDNQIVATIFLSSAFAGAIITACITEKFKRISLVKSGLISNMLLLIFSGYCSTQPDSLTYYIISLICLCLYASNISIVLLGLPYTIMAERLPTEFRAKIFSSLTSLDVAKNNKNAKQYKKVVSILPALVSTAHQSWKSRLGKVQGAGVG
ncbi:hypothetical protein PGB90_002598 [Kerria lacca]